MSYLNRLQADIERALKYIRKESFQRDFNIRSLRGEITQQEVKQLSIASDIIKL